MTPPISADDKRYLVVVADEYRAIIYARDTLTGPLRKLRTFTNETARMKTGELLSDRGGRSFDSHGQGHLPRLCGRRRAAIPRPAAPGICHRGQGRTVRVRRQGCRWPG
jgi:hypothetical protein